VLAICTERGRTKRIIKTKEDLCFEFSACAANIAFSQKDEISCLCAE
jgi:hypothetical protein